MDEQPTWKRGWPWLAWIGALIVVEARALIRKSYPDTLTANARLWFGLIGQPKYGKLRRALLVILLAWLAAHLLSTPGMF